MAAFALSSTPLQIMRPCMSSSAYSFPADAPATRILRPLAVTWNEGTEATSGKAFMQFLHELDDLGVLLEEDFAEELETALLEEATLLDDLALLEEFTELLLDFALLDEDFAELLLDFAEELLDFALLELDEELDPSLLLETTLEEDSAELELSTFSK